MLLFRGFEGQSTININEIVTLPEQANVSWHFRQFFELHISGLHSPMWKIHTCIQAIIFRRIRKSWL